MDCALMCAARDTFIVTPRNTKGVLWMTKGSICCCCLLFTKPCRTLIQSLLAVSLLKYAICLNLCIEACTKICDNFAIRITEVWIYCIIYTTAQ